MCWGNQISSTGGPQQKVPPQWHLAHEHNCVRGAGGDMKTGCQGHTGRGRRGHTGSGRRGHIQGGVGGT